MGIRYTVGMDILTALHPGALFVIRAPHAARDAAALLIADLALRGPLTVLDGGNRFQAYRVAQYLRRQTTQVEAAARHMFISRAFTCYQLLALLENTPALRQPCIILDLLGGFYDDHVNEREVRRLLEACLRQVERLSQFAPVIVTLAPPVTEQRAFMIEQVCARSERVMLQEKPDQIAIQPALFAI